MKINDENFNLKIFGFIFSTQKFIGKNFYLYPELEDNDSNVWIIFENKNINENSLLSKLRLLKKGKLSEDKEFKIFKNINKFQIDFTKEKEIIIDDKIVKSNKINIEKTDLFYSYKG